MEKMEPKIKWLGHASLLIELDKTIFIDPWQIQGGKTADLVLITHSHSDHCSSVDVEKILKIDGMVIGPSDALAEIRVGNKLPLKPRELQNLGWVTIEGVPAYNIGKKFHPKANEWLGYLIHFPQTTIYIAGDTDHIPEMKNLKIDVAIVPVGGTYTMNATEAAGAIKEMSPKLAIPVHFGTVVGSQADAELFASLVKNCEVRILKPEKS